MPISSKLRTTRAVIARTPAYSMIKVEEIDGELTFINTVTGETFTGSNGFRDAMAYADALRVADYRDISPSGVITAGRTTGADVNADRVVRLNNYLSDPANRAALASMGLEDLSGGSVSGRMILFDTENTKSAVQSISRTISENAPGEVVLTDGGMQLFSLSQAVTRSGEAISLSRAQQDVLKQLAEINIFLQDTVAEFFGHVGTALGTPTAADDALTGIGKIVGKMTKRYQSAFSPRDVSSGADIISQLVSEGVIAGTPDEYNLIVDRVEAILKTAAGGYDLLRDEEKVLIARAIEGAESVDTGLTRGMPNIIIASDLSENIFVPKTAESAADVAFKLIEEQLQLRVPDVFSGTAGTYVPDDYASVSADLRKLIQEALKDQEGGDPRKLIEIIEERSGSSSDQLKGLVKKLGLSIETASDGHYLLVGRAQKRILEIKQKTLDDLLRSGSIDATKLKEMRELENEIEAIQASIDSGDRNASRVGIPSRGVLKGEASVIDAQRGILGALDSDFRALEEIHDALQAKIRSGETLSPQEQSALQYAEMMFRLRASFDKRLTVADISALKKEIIVKDPFIAQNIAKSKGAGVFVEDMLLLNDPEFITNPQRIRRVQAMIDAEVRSAKEFMETGKIPKEVLDQLRFSATDDLISMQPAARAMAIVNRKQAIEITQALRSGVDPRNIPALVNMISKHHISQAFKSEGESVAVRIPDALRYKIATRTSMQEPIITEFGLESMSSVAIKDSAGRSIDLPMVNFITRGKQLIVADSVASTYKAAEGGFDLDDSGLPMLGTYTDDKGRTRIAAVTMRDPKGRQESILMKPQLKHAETLKAMLADDSDRIVRQVEKASSADIQSLVGKVRDSANISQIDAQSAVDIAMEVIRSERGMDPKAVQDRSRVLQDRLSDLRILMGGEEADVALETAVRIMREGMYGERLGESLTAMAPINQRFLETLAERASAAIRGRDVLDPATGLPVGPFSNLGVEQGAPYADKYLVELGRKPDAVSAETIEPARKALLDSLGIRPESLSVSEMPQLFNAPRRSSRRCT